MKFVFTRSLRRNFDAAAESIASIALDYERVRSAVRVAEPDEVLDPRGVIDESLDAVIASLSATADRVEKIDLSTRETLPDVRQSATRLRQIALDSRDVVTRLQWEIGEHDAPLLGLIGDVASSEKELTDLLERLASSHEA
ncbi:hypothetical protein CAL29_28205 [Bordetella genomosp. 10]|uniref:Uncharacterized protein n=1 Tax=Bordetella genomosp. 10 TaxID=1416804 RepID=A0A261S3K9_9BORD|nr:hypothetical protein [Bordetella genomosp. 10]OZI31755.1 hypothetical protein CAL29_28205 [Bordetella genomosp. 10]